MFSLATMSEALIDTDALGVICPLAYVQVLFSAAPPDATTVIVKLVTALAGCADRKGTKAISAALIRAQGLRNNCVFAN